MDKVQAAHQCKPGWLKIKPPSGKDYLEVKHLVESLNLATVCQSAMCPNVAECWGGGTATIMLMGETCTRNCKFCAVKTGNPQGRLDSEEPQKVASAIEKLNLEYVVLTSVDRDDLEDQGAGHFAEVVRQIKAQNPKTLVEVLTPDFSANEALISKVIESGPDVFGHNLETVRRITPLARDKRASFDVSLSVLKKIKSIHPRQYTKSSLMLGMGETDAEIKQTLEDLRSVHCDFVTFGQYLQPTKKHWPVERYITPEEFNHWQLISEQMGFLYAASGLLCVAPIRPVNSLSKRLSKEG
jgi:lipoic acid synthetase